MTDEAIAEILKLATPAVIALSGLFIFIIFGVISIILLFHWNRYGIKRNVTKRVTGIFFSISSILLLVMLLSGISYIL